MAPPLSPLAPARFPDLPPIAGVRLVSADFALRYRNRDDVMVAVLDPGTTAAGVLTRSLTASAPVHWCRKVLAGGTTRAVVVNAGNANAFTGRAGVEVVDATAAAAAAAFGGRSDQICLASTGVIGQPMPTAIIASRLAPLAEKLSADTAAWSAAARAIMTTDTFPKGATRSATLDGVTVTINGFAKGSGMIAPDMATMLAFVFTDAAIAAPALQAMLTAANERSFNCVTVDGDTSTSDTLLLFATGCAGHALVARADDPRAADLRAALNAVLLDLAQQVVRDGEGASKFVTITVQGAEHDAAAKRVALSIANSPLVKTAIAGEDANWGRIVMAVGKAGERADRDLLRISVGGVLIAANGMEVPGYDEAPVVAHMKGLEIDILVELGIGSGQATVWTCDLTHGYIDINGSYRS
ncbi:Glutamate N-acetyltransferase / Amino-acid acetyltransferase [uncultured Gammaproteobacteria bacterium]